jgi:hypothetical protein
MLRRAAPFVLAVMLGAAALSKGVLVIRGHTHAASIYGAIAACEIALVVLVLWTRTRVIASHVAALAFLGAGLVFAAASVFGETAIPCRCLGDLRVSRGVLLLCDGAIVVLATISTGRYARASATDATRG